MEKKYQVCEGVRETHGEKPLVPPWVGERIVVKPLQPKRPMLLRWWKHRKK